MYELQPSSRQRGVGIERNQPPPHEFVGLYESIDAIVMDALTDEEFSDLSDFMQLDLDQPDTWPQGFDARESVDRERYAMVWWLFEHFHIERLRGTSLRSVYRIK